MGLLRRRVGEECVVAVVVVLMCAAPFHRFSRRTRLCKPLGCVASW